VIRAAGQKPAVSSDEQKPTIEDLGESLG
jgi:hypothetical protein